MKRRDFIGGALASSAVAIAVPLGTATNATNCDIEFSKNGKTLSVKTDRKHDRWSHYKMAVPFDINTACWIGDSK